MAGEDDRQSTEGAGAEPGGTPGVYCTERAKVRSYARREAIRRSALGDQIRQVHDALAGHVTFTPNRTVNVQISEEWRDTLRDALCIAADRCDEFAEVGRVLAEHGFGEDTDLERHPPRDTVMAVRDACIRAQEQPGQIEALAVAEAVEVVLRGEEVSDFMGSYSAVRDAAALRQEVEALRARVAELAAGESVAPGTTAQHSVPVPDRQVPVVEWPDAIRAVDGSTDGPVYVRADLVMGRRHPLTEGVLVAAHAWVHTFDHAAMRALIEAAASWHAAGCPRDLPVVQDEAERAIVAFPDRDPGTTRTGDER